jgi:hypothetical protein
MFAGCDLQRQTRKQEPYGEKTDPAMNPHENRSRAHTNPAVFGALSA